MAITFTPARTRALTVLRRSKTGTAFVSNQTHLNRVGHAFVYWQTARWLVDNGFAKYTPMLTRIELTETGRKLRLRRGT